MIDQLQISQHAINRHHQRAIPWEHMEIAYLWGRTYYENKAQKIRMDRRSVQRACRLCPEQAALFKAAEGVVLVFVKDGSLLKTVYRNRKGNRIHR